MNQHRQYTAVVAMDENRAIGYKGDLPWHLPEDLKTFKRITTGHPALMGRLTYDSIGKPLPNRQNIVLSRDPGFCPEGVTVIRSLAELDRIDRIDLIDPEIMVIGGAKIFELMLPLMNKLWVSRIPGTHEADTWFPPFEQEYPDKKLETVGDGFELWQYKRT